jgi:hypothetical protein
MSKPTAVVIGVGAEQGLGAARSRLFALDTVVATIVAAGGSAVPVSTDVTSEPDIYACSIAPFRPATRVGLPTSSF